VKPLGPLAVSRLSDPGLNYVGAPSGLYLQVIQSSSKKKNAESARSWILRVQVGKIRRDIGLGGYSDVPLALAREKAVETKEMIRKGQDPVLAKKAARDALIESQARAVTFRQATAKYLDSMSDQWRNAKHRAQWLSTLEKFAFPIIGEVHVSDVRKEHVPSILEPHWKNLTETSTRVRQGIERILDWSCVRGYRSGPNPAAWRGNLEVLLPSPRKVTKVLHHAALPIDGVGQFLHHLRKRERMSARALEFLILTATRSGEVRLADWSEIDLQAATWSIPASRMKGGKPHKVPLSDTATALLHALGTSEGIVFPGAGGKPLSDMSFTAVCRKMKAPCVPHGFRSSFRDWTAERTAYPHELAEMALAHTIPNKTEAAYRHGDLLEKRKRMMQDWADFCGKVAVPASNVIPPQKAS